MNGSDLEDPYTYEFTTEIGRREKEAAETGSDIPLVWRGVTTGVISLFALFVSMLIWNRKNRV